MEPGMHFGKIINNLKIRCGAGVSKIKTLPWRSWGRKLDVRRIPWSQWGQKLKGLKVSKFRTSKPAGKSTGAKGRKTKGVRKPFNKMRRGSLDSKLKKPRASKIRIPRIPLRSWSSKVFNVRVLVWTLVALIVSVGLLYIQASRIPDNYRPAKLTEIEARKATHRFVRDVAQGFGNKVKLAKPFEWSIKQSTANRYLASMDEIAFSLPNGVRRGKINDEMARMGLADPAVAFQDGKITLMIRSTTFGKVMSAEVSAKLLDNGKLMFTLNATRVGKLPVPSSLLTGKIETLVAKLSGEHPDAISETLAELLAAIDGQPISPSDTWRIQGVKVNIEALTIADGELKLKVRPISPAPK